MSIRSFALASASLFASLALHAWLFLPPPIIAVLLDGELPTLPENGGEESDTTREEREPPPTRAAEPRAMTTTLLGSELLEGEAVDEHGRERTREPAVQEEEPPSRLELALDDADLPQLVSAGCRFAIERDDALWELELEPVDPPRVRAAHARTGEHAYFRTPDETGRFAALLAEGLRGLPDSVDGGTAPRLVLLRDSAVEAWRGAARTRD
jgi:hypothetical protein